MSREYGQHVFPASGRAVEDVEAWVYDSHVKHVMRGEAIARREREAVEKLQRQKNRPREAREETGSVISRRAPTALARNGMGNEMEDSEIEVVDAHPVASKLKGKERGKEGMQVLDLENDIKEINHRSISSTASTKKAKAGTDDYATISSRSQPEAGTAIATTHSGSTDGWGASDKVSEGVTRYHATTTTTSRSSRSALPPSPESEPDYGDDWMAELGASQMDRLDQLCA